LWLQSSAPSFFRAIVGTRPYVDEFVRCYNPGNRHQRGEGERFRCFSYEDLIKRDKANLDIFWLRDDSLGDSSELPDPAVLAAEIVEDLQAALDQFAQIAADLGVGERESESG
jgi:type I restriction enzyme M protein